MDLYKENDQLLKKEMEEDYRRWKDLIINGIYGMLMDAPGLAEST
jgi:hypothetical protein